MLKRDRDTKMTEKETAGLPPTKIKAVFSQVNN